METEKIKANGKLEVKPTPKPTKKAEAKKPEAKPKPPAKKGNRNFILGQVLISKRKGTAEEFTKWADEAYTKQGGESNEKEQATQVSKALSLLEGMGYLKEQDGLFTLLK